MSLMERAGIGLILAGGAVMMGQRVWESWRAAQAQRPSTPHGNPLPKVVHAVLPPKSTQYRRVIILGDTHGCAEELQALLDKLAYRPGVDLLLSVGDLVNKGPDSEKVLKMARDLGIKAARGNHDDAALEAFRAWLAGKDIPKPAKHLWVAGLDAGLAEMLGDLPLTLQLPAYGVIIVHAGLVPGLPLEQQKLLDMEKIRDVVPAAEVALADWAAAELAAGADVDSLPTGSFDWEEAIYRLEAAAAAAKPSAAAALLPGSSGSSNENGGRTAGASSSGGGGGIAAGEVSPAAAGAATLPPHLQLEGREHPNPLGRAWAAVWRGPQHVFFGHDAKRRLQLFPAATGLDTGCVYGGQLTAAVLPPLDEQGRPLLEQRLHLPPDAQEIRLCSGLPAYIIQVPAKEVHSAKLQQSEQQIKARLEEQAKHHTEEALAAQHHNHPVAHRRQQTGQKGQPALEMAALRQQQGAADAAAAGPAAGVAPKSEEEKKRE